MTVSLDWLEKIAAALNLSIANLLPGSRDLNGIEVLGNMGSDCRVVQAHDGASDGVLSIVVSDHHAVAVKLVAPLGPFDVGTMLVGRRIDAPNFEGASGRNCLIKTRSHNVILRKISVEGTTLIASMPFDQKPDTHSDFDMDWIAPVFMAVRYI